MFGIGKIMKTARKIGEKFQPTKLAEKVSNYITGHNNHKKEDTLDDDEKDSKDMNDEVYKKPEDRKERVGSYVLDKELSNHEYAAYVDKDKKKIKNVHRGTASFQDVIDDAKVLVGADRSTVKMKNHESYYAKTKAKHGYKYDHSHTGHSLGGLVARRIGQDNSEKSVSFNGATGFSMEDRKKAKACKLSNNKFGFCKTDTNIKTTGDVVSAMSGSN